MTENLLDANANPIKVLNPIASQLDVMRSTLLGGLLETLRTNLNRKHERVRIFETGRCFFRDGERYVQPLRIAGLAFGPAVAEQWGARNGDLVDFFDLKGDVAALASPRAIATQSATHASLHPRRSARITMAGTAAGWIGELHPRLIRELALPSAPIVFELDLAALTQRSLPHVKPLSRLPIVRRDLAVVLDDAVPVQQVIDALEAAKPAAVDAMSLFDVYRGPRCPVWKKKPCNTGAYSRY